MSGLTLITATSDRPLGIALTQRWLALQQLSRPVDVQWLVCDDGRRKADLCEVGAFAASNANLRLSIEHVEKPPVRSRSFSFRQNVCGGIARAAHDRIVFWEDDDFYPAHWLEYVIGRFEAGDELIGEARAKYYHVRRRRYRELINRAHASLCQTALTRRLAQWIDRRCRTRANTFVDMELWKQGPRCRRSLRPRSSVVGIKGLPGKTGIGMGHRLGSDERHDPDGSVLRRWVGDAAADVYAGLADASHGKVA